MELITSGKEHWTDQHPIFYNPIEEFIPDLGFGLRFRLIFVRNGAGILRLNEHQHPFVGPALFCLNQTERPILQQSANLNAEALYFHPSLVNFSFNYNNLFASSDFFSPTERFDLALLNAFTRRDDTFDGIITIGPSTMNRFDYLFQLLGRELTEQPNKFWMCRSRSYLLELLIHINRLFLTPADSETPPLRTDSEELGPVVFYLHNNFHNKITIEDLTRLFHTNRTTLAERFTSATGMSIISYLIRLRIQLASTLLRDTGLPVVEIMERVGFKDNSHFVKTFQRTTGFSPVEYRRKYTIMD